MIYLLLVANLLFSILNLAILVPIAKIVVEFYMTMNRMDEDETPKKDQGLIDVQPSINYHNVLPSVDLDRLNEI